MEYLPKAHYDFIMQKYHSEQSTLKHYLANGGQPYGYDRFVRRDELFSADSGMAPDGIYAWLEEYRERNKHLSHYRVKAEALSFILQNTRIECDERDIFPLINMIDRPVEKAIARAWMDEVNTTLAHDLKKKADYLEKSGLCVCWPDYNHSVPNWERVLAYGFSGLLTEINEAAKHAQTQEEAELFDGIRIVYEAVIGFVGRLYERARLKGCEKMASALFSIKFNPPKTFYEVLLTVYIYFMVSEHIDRMQVRSLGNLDRLFGPYYESDLKNGKSEDELKSELAYFMLQFASIGNYWNQPLYLGGTKENGESEINGLSQVVLQVYDGLGIYNPKIQIKVGENTPRAFLDVAFDMLRRGKNTMVFVFDNAIKRALMGAGASEDDARTCIISGCFEPIINEGYIAMMNYVNALKPLEYALHCGRDGFTGEAVGLSCREPDGYTAFEQLFGEYLNQLDCAIDNLMEVTNGYDEYLSLVSPQLLLSGTFKSALQKRKDAIGGGARLNNSYVLLGGFADTVDSLAMIKKYVFDKGVISLGELTKALDGNFEGNERLRMRLLSDTDKYGNNRELPDTIARRICDFLHGRVCGKPTGKRRGGTWTVGTHVARMVYNFGKSTIASPNGRLCGEELSKNATATLGQNREGVTGMVASVAKLGIERFAATCPIDVSFAPATVNGERGQDLLYAAVMTACKCGVQAMNVNIFDGQTLRAAQREPERYADLQVRVAGWNVLFSSISPKEQEAFIRQAMAER